MEAHQERVVEEKKELDKKLKDLEQFIYESPVYKTVSMCEKARLVDQLEVMRAYSSILNLRIVNF